ncbi:hypothetical protein R3P38DRAFT_2847194 [Favolaschia claudopus]|uniref:NADH dehydrogenase [ubiquinone] 1 alpha subcomplex subunit 6 n=1 Tax=Favolaschia claudopus TaxID=2862362 RepID=A0AAW0DVA0_9AGAR
MTTIPSRLAQMTRVSSSPAEARERAILMYRDWYRAAPEIVTQYALEVSPTQLRHAIRMRFERNRHVTDVRVIDGLLLKSRQEYQETLNMWKQPDHIYGILMKPQDRPSRSFLQKFYEGRDEEGIIPAASGV